MNIMINGTPVKVPQDATLASILKERNLFEQPGVAVAKNRTLIRRAEWSNTAIHEGDELEILHATAGG